MDTNIEKQLIYLVTQNTGVQLEKIIEQILESKLILINEILIHPNVQSLNNPEGSNKYYNTLKLFSRGNYFNYKKGEVSFLTLTEKMLTKLKILTILDLSKEKKVLKLDELSGILDMKDLFELETIIFEAQSLSLLKAKIDQKNSLLKVFSVNGRDFIENKEEAIGNVEKWIKKIETSENFLKNEITKIESNTKSNDVYTISNSVLNLSQFLYQNK